MARGGGTMKSERRSGRDSPLSPGGDIPPRGGGQGSGRGRLMGRGDWRRKVKGTRRRVAKVDGKFAKGFAGVDDFWRAAQRPSGRTWMGRGAARSTARQNADGGGRERGVSREVRGAQMSRRLAWREKRGRGRGGIGGEVRLQSKAIESSRGQSGWGWEGEGDVRGQSIAVGGGKGGG